MRWRNWPAFKQQNRWELQVYLWIYRFLNHHHVSILECGVTDTMYLLKFLNEPCENGGVEGGWLLATCIACCDLTQKCVFSFPFCCCGDSLYFQIVLNVQLVCVYTILCGLMASLLVLCTLVLAGPHADYVHRGFNLPSTQHLYVN